MPPENPDLRRDALAARAKELAEKRAARAPSDAPKLGIPPIGSYADDFGRKDASDRTATRRP